MGIGEPYQVPEIEPGLVVCKSSTLPAFLSLWPREIDCISLTLLQVFLSSQYIIIEFYFYFLITTKINL